jgi:hypothetical protein
MRGDGEVHRSSAVLGYSHECKQQLARYRRDHKKVSSNEALHVILKKSAPCLRRRIAMTNHVLGHGGVRDFDPEFQ